MSLFGNLFNQEEKVKRRKLTQGDKDNILKKQGDKCAKCGKKFYARSVIHWDHKKALALGGSDTLRNRQALCPNCHAEKTRQDRTKISKHKKKKKKDPFDDPLGLGNIFGPSKKGKKPKSIWDI